MPTIFIAQPIHHDSPEVVKLSSKKLLTGKTVLLVESAYQEEAECNLMWMANIYFVYLIWSWLFALASTLM